MDIKEYIDKKGITCKVSQVADNPAMRPANSASAQEKQWYREASHYKVTLKRPDGRRMKVPFSCGSACGKPDAATVLDCLCSDATFPDTFEDFCSEFGYDTDSRRAERTFKACLKTRDELREFLGDDFDAVVYEMERM
jgi:hypothetical protein